jgi:predicted lactoylglutathione lyase
MVRESCEVMIVLSFSSSAHINRNLDKAKEDIHQNMDETLDNQKFIASEVSVLVYF